MEIKSVFDATENTGIKMLIYGRAGTGKTRMCATLEKPLILSAEQGLLSLKKVISEKRIELGNPNYDLPHVSITSLKDFEHAYDEISSGKYAGMFKSICVDSMTEIVEIILKEEKTKTSHGMKAYGAMYERAIELFRKFRDLDGYNVYFIAHEKRQPDAMQNIMCSAEFPGQILSPASMYQFDFNLRAFTATDDKGEKFYALQTGSSEFVDAKDRSGKLDFIEYPDLGHLINKAQS